MKTQIKLFIYCIFIGYCSNAAAQTTKPWKLVWSDEFNYTGPPDSTKWGYERATHRSHEEQVYTDRKKNVYVKNGFLTITGYKEEYPNVRYMPNNTDWDRSDPFMHYTSASLTTRYTASWKYGKIEVRAKVPSGAGTWPAIWMLGVDKANLGWPRQGEIDIMEAQGRIPKFTTGTLHFADKITSAPIKTGNNLLPLDRPLSADFHIYSAIWDSTKVTLLFDNKEFFTYKFKDKDIVFNQQPFYLIINLALGGAGGGPIDDTIFPAKYVIDYVRIYQNQ
ncbi:glycoside hydrolase family 16 protein [Mucilaginibacter sp. CAU 1740]|uniref:glycoside hydrolase family 16 protein n=1 Tax=Mucilaginibacter sp. CAU 1740 TaxID=3140365 RepID=UPI00325ACE56